MYPPDCSVETLRDVIIKKTVSLFEISFVLGWLYGGGDHEKLPLVKKAAEHFGIAFQIVDDLGDMEQDAENERAINVPARLGVDVASKMFHEEIEHYSNIIKELGIDVSELQALADLLIARAEKRVLEKQSL